MEKQPHTEMENLYGPCDLAVNVEQLYSYRSQPNQRVWLFTNRYKIKAKSTLSTPSVFPNMYLEPSCFQKLMLKFSLNIFYLFGDIEYAFRI